MRVPMLLLIQLPAAGVAVAQTPTPQRDDDLVGLWGNEAVFGPRVSGPVTVQREGPRWTLRIAGLEAASRVAGDSIRIALAGAQGTFRARVERDGSLRGFWIQPAGNLQPFASPVVLARRGPQLWTGRVAPIIDRLSLYLRIWRMPDNSLRAAFHNPEVRWNGRSPWFRVTRGDGVIKLADTTGRPRFAQPYDSGARQIAMEFGAPMVLNPRVLSDAVGFVARSPDAPMYSYRAPVPLDDGWRIAAASAVGVNEDSLAAIVRDIISADPTAPRPMLVHSVLVARRGQLVLDEYFYGYSAERPHDMRSATKTITGLLAGIAVDQGKLRLDTPVWPLLDPASRDSTRSRITVENLLTHSSGLACDDNNSESPGNEDRMQQQRTQRDWYRFTLELPVSNAPGATYAYCSAGINLAGGVVRKVTGTPLLEFLERTVARPLGMSHYAVNLMPDGDAYAGGGMHLRPRDMIKLAQLHLDGGVWNGVRVVSGAWVRRATAPHITLPDSSADGYAWHIHSIRAAGRSWRTYEASGNGGQLAIVVPDLSLVVGFTGGNYNQYGIWRRYREELLPRVIAAATASGVPVRGAR